MSVTNWHRENTYGYKLESKCPKPPKGKHLVEIDIVCDPEGSNALECAKKQLIEKLLIAYEGNTYAVSRAMGVSKRTIRNWLNSYPELRRFASSWCNEVRKNI